ncbi:MAG: sugar ABC transporter permease [Promicromonosporaceae bacterium]|nr:sugar ABC transporter permease [Promicromonosporaceae bacterium]
MTDSLRENAPASAGSPVDLSTGEGSAAALPSLPPVRRRQRRGGWKAGLEITALSAPAVVVFLVFVILPVIMAAYYGFFRWKGFGPPTDWAGFHNYVVIFQDPDFRQALLHNFQIVVLSLVIQGPVAIAFALLLNKKMRGQSIIRVLIFVPYVISEAVAGIGWAMLLADNGAFNALMDKVGLHGLSQSWLANPSLAIWTLMAILTWKYIGYAVILFLAGLQSIPEELTEAASIDGASYWQTQRHIVLPLLGPTIRIWAFLSIIGSLQLFDIVYIIWGQYVTGTAGVSTMATYMNANGRVSGNFGYGSAVAVVMFIISLIIALFYQRFVLRRDTAGAVTDGEG